MIITLNKLHQPQNLQMRQLRKIGKIRKYNSSVTWRSRYKTCPI